MKRVVSALSRGQGRTNEFSLFFQAVLLQGVTIARKTIVEDSTGLTAEKADAAVPLVEQVLRRHERAERVVGAGIVVLALAQRADHDDQRNAPRVHLLDQRGRRAQGGAKDDSGGVLLSHRVHQLGLQFEVLAGVGHQRDVAGLDKPSLDADQHFGEEGIHQIVDDDADHVARLAAHVGSAPVVDVADLRGDLANLRRRRLLDQRTAVEDQRDGGLRNARGTCHVVDGRVAARHRGGIGHGSGISRCLTKSC